MIREIQAIRETEVTEDLVDSKGPKERKGSRGLKVRSEMLEEEDPGAQRDFRGQLAKLEKRGIEVKRG